MSRVPRLLLAVATLALVLASPATAQSTANASIQALAFVQGVAPITATGVNDLDFGIVLAGTPTSPTSLASQAGRWDITGEPGAPLTASLTLPLTLDGAGGSIPISFSATDGLHWNPFPTTSTTFDPNIPYLTNLDGSGNLTLGISGTVSPPAATTTGNYTGTITLTVSYL
jgi:spore coat protein U-like protein